MAGREKWRAKFASDLPSHVAAFPIFASLCLLLVLSFGGGTRPGMLSDIVTQIFAIPLLLWALWKLVRGEAGETPKLSIVLLALLILYPLAQLLPLFPQSAGGSVGRQLHDEVLALVGPAQSGMVTVSADATLLSVISLLPAAAIFIATLVLPPQQRRWFVVIVIGFSFVSVLVGLLQLSQGRESSLRFYEITNSDDAVGFFANRNHFSALLNCALVLSSAWLLYVASGAGFTSATVVWRQVFTIVGFTLVVSLLAAQAMTRSRAGVGIAVVALASSCAMMPGLMRPDTKTNPLRVFVVTIALGIIFGIQYGTFRLIERFGSDPLQDARKSFAENTYDAITSFLPFGSGLGTFTHVYPAFERLENALVGAYVNRAHNDLIEYVLETGIFALVLLGVATVYFLVRAIRLWRPGRPVTLDLMLQRAAACVLVLILLHSVFDYPLRTGAMLSLLAVSAGLLLSAWPASGPEAAEAAPRGNRSGSGRPRSRSPRDSNEAQEPDAVLRPSDSLPQRKTWGQDVTWPEAWKSDAKKSTD